MLWNLFLFLWWFMIYEKVCCVGMLLVLVYGGG